MSKVTIEYNLPEEQDELDQANSAGKYYSVLWDLDQYLRNYVRYPAEGVPELLTDTMAQVRDELWKLMNEHNVDLSKF